MSIERSIGTPVDQPISQPPAAPRPETPVVPEDFMPSQSLAKELGLSKPIMARLLREGAAGGFRIWRTERDRRQKLISRQELIDYIAPHPKPE